MGLGGRGGGGTGERAPPLLLDSSRLPGVTLLMWKNISVCLFTRVVERERERDGETERQRDRETEGQRERERGEIEREGGR